MTHSSTPPPAGIPSQDLSGGTYTDTLERSTGRFASFAVAFAFVSIATGIFTTYGSVLKSSGPLGIWTWPIVIVGQLAVALLLGALAARIPVTGYAYQWVSRLANPILGWITAGSRSPSWPSWPSRWTTPSPRRSFRRCSTSPARH